MRVGHHTILLILALAAVTGGCGMTTSPGGATTMMVGGREGLRAPDFTGGVAWFNSKPLSIKDLRGKVVIVDFWEFTCVNCIRTLPYLESWHEKYADKGLVIVGVHTPEFSFAADSKAVGQAVQRFGLKYPVVADSDRAIWTAYANSFWPRKFLVDKDGVIRYDHIGEGGYQETEHQIQELLKQINPALTFPAMTELVRDTDKPGAVCYPMTPELYCGYTRGDLGNAEGFFQEKSHRYQDPGKKQEGLIYLHGPWKAGRESTAYDGDPGDGYIGITFRGADVNAVWKPAGDAPVEVEALLDGKPVPPGRRGEDLVERGGRTFFTVDVGRMYRIIKGAYGAGELRLLPQQRGVAIYAYTFGTACVTPPK